MMTLFVIVLAASNIKLFACQRLGVSENNNNNYYARPQQRAGPFPVDTEDINSANVGDQIKKIQRYVEALVKELSGLEAKQATLQRKQTNTSRSLDQIVTTVEKLSSQLSPTKTSRKDPETKRLRKDLKSLRNKTHERIKHLKTKLWALVNELTAFVNESNYNTTKIFKLTFKRINENKRAIADLRNFTRSFVKDIVKKKMAKFKEKMDKFISKKVQEHIKNQTISLSKRLLNRAAEGCWETSCYYFREVWSTWPEAKSYCKRINGDLAAFETKTEEVQVMQMAPEWARVNQTYTHSFWLDGSSPDTERWHWAKSGQQLNHTNWLEGYPNVQRPTTPPNELELCLKTCFSINGDNGWCNANCFERNPYICEV